MLFRWIWIVAQRCLPFNPSVRPGGADRVDGVAFLEQPKTIVSVSPEQVAAEPTTIGAVVFPEFQADRSEAFVLSRLSVVQAAQALVAQSLNFKDDKSGSVRAAWRLAEAVPAYRLSYRDAASAAIELTEMWPLAFRAQLQFNKLGTIRLNARLDAKPPSA